MKRQKVRKGIILVSFFLFPAVFYYLSPVLIIRASLEGIINGSFIIFILMFLSALFLGRGYCGWLCPAAGCQEAIFLSRNNKVTGGDFIKWIIWILWIISISTIAIISGGYKEIDFFYQTTHGISIGNFSSAIAYFVVLLLIVMPAFIFGKRSFCHHICWMAPFMIISRSIRNHFKWQSLQLKAFPDECAHCNTCSNNCPMSLPVENMVTRAYMENRECILCGTCVDGCRQRAIKFSWK